MKELPNMQEERSDAPVPGSLAHSDDWWIDHGLKRLWSRSSGPVIPCEGCGIGVQRSRYGKHGKWCRRCAVIAEAMSPLRRAARQCAALGLSDAVVAIEKALEDLRVAMQANQRTPEYADD